MSIRSQPANDKYRDNFDRIFGKNKTGECKHALVHSDNDTWQCHFCGQEFDSAAARLWNR